jgi:hypothetical protein
MRQDNLPDPLDFGFMRWAPNPYMFVTPDGHEAVTHERAVELIREARGEEKDHE